MTIEIVFATGNRGKWRELHALVSPEGFEVILGAELGLPEVVEDGASFADNARKKAQSAARFTGKPALADDSGLEVAHLGGAPGIHSARYAGAEADAAANNLKLLAALAGVPPAERRARFVCALFFFDPRAGPADATTHLAWGTCEGLILEAPRGEGGFGYDPLFYYPPAGRTFAELPADEKNRVSHRAHAFGAMARFLRRLARPAAGPTPPGGR